MKLQIASRKQAAGLKVQDRGLGAYPLAATFQNLCAILLVYSISLFTAFPGDLPARKTDLLPNWVNGGPCTPVHP